VVLGLLSPAIAVRRGMERLEAKRRSTLALLSFLYFLALLSACTLVSQHEVPKSGLWKSFSGAPAVALATAGHLARHLKGLPVVKPRGAGPRRFRARGILPRTALNLGKTAGPPSR